MARSSLIVFFLVVLLFASVEGAIKKCRQDQKTLISNPDLFSAQKTYHSEFLQSCMSSFEQTTEFADNLFECKANLVNPEAYREACTAAGGLKNVVVNSHMNIKKENTDILVSVAWFQCVSSSCSIETDLPYIAASQRRDVDFGAALLESPTLAPTYVDGLTFFFAKQQPSDDYYGYSSSSSSDPYGYSSSSSSDPYGYSSSSSSSDPYGYSSSSSSDPYGYYSSSSSSSDPYGYSSSSSDPYGYYSSSSSSDPYGYSSSSSSDPYGYSSSSSSSDPYGYSSSSSSDPYGYYSSSSSDPYGYSSSSSDPYGYYSSPYPEEDSNEKHHKKEKHHKGSHHSKHDELSSPSTADSAFALLFSSVGVIFVFLMLVIFAVLGLALFRRRSAANNSFALVDEHRYPSKEV